LLRQSAQALPDESAYALHLALADFAQGEPMEEIIAEARRIGFNADEDTVANDAATLQTFLEASNADQIPPELVDRARAVGEIDPLYLAARMTVARDFENREEFDQAILAYQEILRRAPKVAPAVLNAALIYAEHFGDDDKALDLATRARELLPEDPDVASLLGRIAYRRQDYDWAGRLLSECLPHQPEDPEILFLLGFCRMEENKTDAGRELLGRALDADPDSPYATKARRLLAGPS
jgi:tetratricopeptide (TPR) repeat protein